jgi:methionyl-tRNA formyltransferase
LYEDVQLIVIYVAMQESFLSELRPELCITAAYGNILPQRFLDIPPCGKS